jgi:hypothetical protein
LANAPGKRKSRRIPALGGPSPMSRHQKKTGRDMFSYFIEFCGLEGFERRWSAIYVELMYRYVRRITCTYVDSVG